MSNTSAERSPDTSSKAIANQNNGKNGIAMPSVPALQKKAGIEESDDAAIMDTAQFKNNVSQKAGAAEDSSKQFKPFQLQSRIIPKQATEGLPAQGKFQPVQRKNNNTGLPDNLKSGVEQLSGYAMDDVKVHYNSSQPAQLNALAYAQGTDIHVAPGQEKHLPHEAWHVAQQKQGRVQPTVQMKAGVPVNDDPGLENEADVMGAKAIQMKADKGTGLQLTVKSISSQAIQRVVYKAEAFGAAYSNPIGFINTNYTVRSASPKIVEEGGSGGAKTDAASSHGRDIINKFTQNAGGMLEAAAQYLSAGDAYAKTQGEEAIVLAYKAQRTPVEVLDWYRKSSLKLSEWTDPRFVSAKQDGGDGGLTVRYHYDREKAKLTATEFPNANERAVMNGPSDQGHVMGHYAVDNLEHRFINHVHVNKGDKEEESKESIIYETNNATAHDWGEQKYERNSRTTRKEKIRALMNASSETLESFDKDKQQTRDQAGLVGLANSAAGFAALPAALATWVTTNADAVVERILNINISKYSDMIHSAEDKTTLNLHRILYECLADTCKMAWDDNPDNKLTRPKRLNNFEYYFGDYMQNLTAGNEAKARGELEQYDDFVAYVQFKAWVDRETADPGEVDLENTITKVNTHALGLNIVT
jgi:hypothetical protein